MDLTKQHFVDWMSATTALMKEHETYLTELDSPIGDADHGRNMVRGFERVNARLKTVADRDIGTILKTVALTLMSTSGGACGQLYANFFLRGAAALEAKEAVDLQELIEFFNAGLEGVYQRGRAVPGEKTIIDTLTPATHALQSAFDRGLDMTKALALCLEKAERGMKETIPLQAKKGRASYLGERSIGHQDPGATSAYFIIEALVRSAAAK
ncbi:MAG: dihydroxyacetone kinase subunit DhaL [Chloroflexota bacterium]